MSSPVKSVPDTMSLEEVSSAFRKDGFRHDLVEDAKALFYFLCNCCNKNSGILRSSQ